MKYKALRCSEMRTNVRLVVFIYILLTVGNAFATELGALKAKELLGLKYEHIKRVSTKCERDNDRYPKIGCTLRLNSKDPKWAEFKYCSFHDVKPKPEIEVCYYNVKNGTPLSEVMGFVTSELGAKYVKSTSLEHDTEVRSFKWRSRGVEVSLVFNEEEHKKYTVPEAVFFNSIRSYKWRKLD